MRKYLALMMVLALCLCAACAYAEVTLTEVAKIKNTNVRWITIGDCLQITNEDGSVYLADRYGNRLSEADFDTMNHSNGAIVVSGMSGGMDNKGVLTPDGRLVVPTEYDAVEVFNEHWAAGVKFAPGKEADHDYYTFGSKKEYYVIDQLDLYNLTEGKLMKTFARENYLRANAEGEYINIQDRVNNQVTGYDKDMNVVQENGRSLYTFEAAPQPDVRGFYYNGKYGLENADGDLILREKYDLIYTFYRGLAMTKLDEKYGLVREDGVEVLEPKFDDVLTQSRAPLYGDSYSVHEAFGYFGVINDGKFAFVDSSGNVTQQTECTEDQIEFYGATAEDEEKKVLYAADGTHISLEAYPELRCLSYTSGMLFTIRSDGAYGLVDWHGKEVLPVYYRFIDVSDSGCYLAAVEHNTTFIYEIDYGMEITPNFTKDDPAAE